MNRREFIAVAAAALLPRRPRADNSVFIPLPKQVTFTLPVAPGATFTFVGAVDPHKQLTCTTYRPQPVKVIG